MVGGPDPAASPSPSAPGQAWFWLAAVAGLCLLVVGMVDAINLTVDDVFISFRYAENSARGLGLVFNPGERVEGYSNLLWTLLLAGLAKLGANQRAADFPLLVPAKLIGAAFGLATYAALVGLAERRRRSGEWGSYAPLAGLAPLALGASYSFGMWSVSGMETPACAFFVLLALALQLGALRRLDDTGSAPAGRLAAAGALFGVATLVRPEPVFVWALATAVFAAVAPRGARRALLGGAAITLAVYGLSVVWRWNYYGALLPNSVVAKTGGGLHSAILGGKYALAALFGSVGFLALGFVGLPALLGRRAEWRYLACFSAAYALFVAASGGDWMPGYRLLVPALAPLALLAVGSLLAFCGQLSPRPSRVGLAALVALLALLGFASERNLVRSQRAFPSGFKQLVWQSSPLRIEVAKALGQVVPAGGSVALAECGYIPYLNPDLRFVDVLGLMDPTFARLPAMDVDYFLRRAPDYYLVMVRWGRPSRESLPLLASPAFRQRYRQVAYFDGLERRLRAMREGVEPQLEEDQSFALFRRMP